MTVILCAVTGHTALESPTTGCDLSIGEPLLGDEDACGPDGGGIILTNLSGFRLNFAGVYSYSDGKGVYFQPRYYACT
jgi:hypothetical protein